MLTLSIPSGELWVSATREFIYTEGVELHLEHSLATISKWESKWHKAFFSKRPRTREEMLDYMRCMCLDENVDPLIFLTLTKKDTDAIEAYMLDSQTATYIWEFQKEEPSNETVTSELIYYWMISLQIPFECQYWHINRLMSLIKLCNAKNDNGPKKYNEDAIRAQYAEINRKRREMWNTKG